MNHEQDWHSAIVARALPCSTNNRFNRFFASFEISWKYSSGNEKSHFKMFAVVSSTESSKNGETPLKNTYNKTPKHQQSAQEKWAFISVLLKESTHKKTVNYRLPCLMQCVQSQLQVLRTPDSMEEEWYSD